MASLRDDTSPTQSAHYTHSQGFLPPRPQRHMRAFRYVGRAFRLMRIEVQPVVRPAVEPVVLPLIFSSFDFAGARIAQASENGGKYLTVKEAAVIAAGSK